MTASSMATHIRSQAERVTRRTAWLLGVPAGASGVVRKEGSRKSNRWLSPLRPDGELHLVPSVQVP